MTTLLNAARAYAKAHPRYDGGSWAGHCGSLMYRFNGHKASYSTAAVARVATPGRLNTNLKTAPVGAFHFFELGSAGHVGMDLTAGGRSLFMSSNFLGSSWGDHIGTQSVAGYVKKSGARYLGWALTYGNQKPLPADDLGDRTRSTVKASAKAVLRAERRRVAIHLNALKLGRKTAASSTGIVGPNYWWLLQKAAKREGLYGRGYLVNGIPGPKTRSIERLYRNRY